MNAIAMVAKRCAHTLRRLNLAPARGAAQLLSAAESHAGLVLGEGTASIFTAAGTAVAHAVLR